MGSAAITGVGLGGKPDETVIVEVDTEGVNTGQEDIETEVKLGLVD